MPGFYNPTPSSEECLAHFGILGQKWGKKNGPPYPLGADDHSASEKKAGWRKSLTGDSAKNEDRKGQLSEKKRSKLAIKYYRNMSKAYKETTKLRDKDPEFRRELDDINNKANSEYKKLDDKFIKKLGLDKNKKFMDNYFEEYSELDEKDKENM